MLGFPDLSWPVRSGIVYKSVFEQYTWSLFRALAQMFSIGYGSPGEAVLTVPEAWNLIVSFTLGALIWVLMTGMIVSLLVQMNGLDSEYRRGFRCPRAIGAWYRFGQRKRHSQTVACLAGDSWRCSTSTC